MRLDRNKRESSEGTPAAASVRKTASFSKVPRPGSTFEHADAAVNPAFACRVESTGNQGLGEDS